MLQDNLIMLRNMYGMSQEEIAVKIGISRQAYAKWESGATMPNPVQLAKLAAIYCVEVGKFFEFDFNFNVASPDYEGVYGDNYVSELSDEERYLLACYRLLNRNDKEKVMNYVKGVRE